MKPRWQLALSLAVVSLIYAFHVQLKTTKIFAHPSWHATEEVGQFWSEFAVHYGFAKFFAQHPLSDWGQLAQDRTVQHPDTLNDWTEFALAMEIPVGVLYRWVQPALPFHVWVVWYNSLVGSLALFGVFLLARELWRSHFAGVLGALLYAALYPSYGRTVKNLFLKEDFALPLILLALWGTVRLLRCPEPASANEVGARQPVGWLEQVGVGLLWVAALASWHLTQFLLAVGVAAAVLVYLGYGEIPRRPWLVATLAVGGLAVPMLWAKQFWISPTMCGLYALGLAVWINGGRRRAALVFLGWLAGLLAVSFALRQSYGEYAHVYQLFLAKLRFLGVKPEDPALLGWEARSLWEGAFETALAPDFWKSLGWTLPLGFVAVWRLEKRRDWTLPRRLFVVFVLLLVPLSWMVIRFLTFLAPMAAVLVASLVLRGLGWKLVVSAVALWQLTRLDYAPLDRGPVRPSAYQPIVHWVRQHTPTNAVILASISETPVLWAHTGRSMILHSKFENRLLRERYREFLGALYESEAALHGLARRWGADYVLFDRGSGLVGPNTWRYKADRLGPLPPAAPARVLDPLPVRTRYFELLVGTERFGLYRPL